ncbi:MAG: extracellular solute-binding protein [Clostridia bacterium]|nr:extracellular solute-binding protein [Clostridia bacterium]
MKRTTSILLLTAMLASLASCGGDAPAADTTAAGASDATADAEVTTEETDGLPDTDMEGFTFHILHADDTQFAWVNHQLKADEENGDLVNDAVFKRNRYIEDRFNCKLDIEETTKVDTKLASLVMSNEAPDLALMEGRQVIANIDYIADFNNLPNLNLEADYWNPNASSIFDIGGKQLALAGNYILCYISSASCFMYNKELYEELQIKDNLYDLVNEGKWTTEKFYEISRMGVYDLNGDTKMDKNDRMGSLSLSLETYYGALLIGAGFKFVLTDDKDYFSYNIGGNERMISFMQDMLDRTIAEPYLYYTTATQPGSTDAEIKFENGQGLFYQNMLTYVDDYRDMEMDFGIVPSPKLDENQDQYYSRAALGEIAVLPRSFDMDRAENVGTLLEAMSYHSQKNLVQTYKEVMVKTKLTRDDDSADMLEYVFNGITFDAGMHLMGSINTTIMKNVYLDRKDVLVSTIDSVRSVFDSTVKTISEKIDEVP